MPHSAVPPQPAPSLQGLLVIPVPSILNHTFCASPYVLHLSSQYLLSLLTIFHRLPLNPLCLASVLRTPTCHRRSRHPFQTYRRAHSLHTTYTLDLKGCLRNQTDTRPLSPSNSNCTFQLRVLHLAGPLCYTAPLPTCHGLRIDLCSITSL